MDAKKEQGGMEGSCGAHQVPTETTRKVPTAQLAATNGSNKRSCTISSVIHGARIGENIQNIAN